jgi:hypothetical protein
LGQEKDQWQVGKELLGVRVLKLMGGIVPLATLKIHAVDITAIFGLLLDVLVSAVVLDVELEVKAIDSNIVLS